MKYTPNDRRLPAEWEEQFALLLTWPHAHGLWHSLLPKIEDTFAAVAAIASHSQQVIISCFDEDHKIQVKQALQATDAIFDNIHLFVVPSNDSWTRDHGPISVKISGKTALVKFRFNAWGEKYRYDLDNEIVNKLDEAGAFNHYPLQQANWILEGGSLETDGEGTLLTTESCLLNPTRNPELTREQIEQKLHEDLGITRVLWLKNSQLLGDDTDGHIDMLARFCNPQTICYTTAFPGSVDEPSLSRMETELRALKTTKGEPYTLIPLPPIEPKYAQSGEQLCASYANFLILNDAVIVPIFGDKNDDKALEVIKSCFPNRSIYGINGLHLVHNHGVIHCATMNIYA